MPREYIEIGYTLGAKPGQITRKGMVFQAYTSFPWLTVLENIRFGTRYRDEIGAEEKEEISRHYLNLVGLDDFADFYVNRISGGMRQRVAIARTLAAGPDILLMDEPFGALDAQTREFLQYQLLEISRIERKAVIFVTHDVEEAVFLADRIFIFSARPARIVEEIRVGEIIIGLTRSWARELAPDILVNAVAPGPVDTPMLSRENMSPEVVAQESDLPLGRIGQPEEIASVIAFLAGPGASYVTGQTFGPNGGAVMT